MTRDVTLALVDDRGELLGGSPSFTTALPFWPEMSDLVPAAAERLGVTPTVLRLLRAERPRPHGGAVTYLAQVADRPAVALTPVADDLAALVRDDDPLRAPYARVGGPAASVRWAADALGVRAADLTAHQGRTWNLSALTQLTDGRTTWWLKQLPAFLRAEPAMLGWLAGAVPEHAPVAVAIGTEGRVLQQTIAGDDLYDADLATRLRILDALHRIQRTAADDVGGLLARGIPDRRGHHLAQWIRTQLAGWADDHPASALIDGLDGLADELDACGLPATVVHGDMQGGNARGDDEHLTILDWGEATVGHPVLDVVTLTLDLTPADAAPILDAWVEQWRRTAPRSDPARALALGRPFHGLRNAALYAHFVANIEATERPYHAADVPEALDRAVAASGEPR